MRRLLVLSAFAIAFSGLAQAQPNQATVVVSRGLVAQYEAALIRERRLADQREHQLITTYEARMRELSTRVDRGEDTATSELEQARTQYASFVGPIAARDSRTAELVAAYRAQIEQDVAQASPEQLAALQRFADGDQQAGFDQYQAESQRRAAARRQQVEAAAEAAAQSARAADAADARQLARLGETMRLQGTKTVAELITLWDRAGELDPSDFGTQLMRAELVALSGDLSRGRTLAARAREIAKTDDEIYQVTYATYQIALSQGDWTAVMQAEREIPVILRRIADANPSNYDAQLDARLSEAHAMSVTGNRAGAIAILEEELAIARRRAAAEPNNLRHQRVVGLVLLRLAAAQQRQGNTDGELSSLAESVTIARRLANTDPSNVRDQRILSASLVALADAQSRARDPAGRLASLEENVAVFRAVAAANPQDVMAQMELGESLNQLAVVQGADGARASLSESLAIARSVASTDPSNAEAHRGIWVTMWRLSAIPNSGITWADIVVVMEYADRHGWLVAADRHYLDEARDNAQRENVTAR